MRKGYDVCPRCGGEKAKVAKVCRECWRNRGRRPTTERFWEKVEKEGHDGCWIWTGTLRPDGYGVIGLGGREEGIARVHRLSYKWARGPIPDGMFVCHECDRPACVNPAHLFLGDAGDNIRDAVKKGRHAHGETASYSKLTKEQVVEIRRRYAGENISQYKLAEEYPVSRSMIGLIVTGERWAHLS